MSGRFAGKVAVITGAARGQGRSHALQLAEEGADIVAIDLCGEVETVAYPLSTVEDLEETARLVREHGRRVLTRVVDVRDHDGMIAVVADAVEELGRVDVAVPNAGIATYAAGTEIPPEAWRDMIDINLTGVWHTIKAVAPQMVAQRSGSIVIVNSASGLIGPPNLAHYVAAKHGAIGLMRSFANELGPHMVRVNSVCPTQVDTPMIMHDEIYRMFRPDLEAPTKEDIVEVSTNMNLLPVPWVEPQDVSKAVAFLASDDARYITGVALSVDAGIAIKVSLT